MFNKKLLLFTLMILIGESVNCYSQIFPGWTPPENFSSGKTNNELLNSLNKPVINADLTLTDAVQILSANNISLKQADKAIEIAKATRQKLNSLWFPFIAGSGMYTHLSQNIETRNNIGELVSPKDGDVLTPIKEALNGKLPSSEELVSILHQFFPNVNQQLIADLITGVGKTINEFASSISAATLTVPILDNNVATFDVSATWPVFTGGKRIYSSKIGKTIINQAENLKSITYDTQTTLLIQTYYTLKLSQEVIKVKEDNVNAMTLLYSDALKLLKAGMINKAELLTTQVAMDEAIRQLQNSKDAESVVQTAIKNILNIKDSTNTNLIITPTTQYPNLTIIPTQEYFDNLISENNKLLQALDLQKNIFKNQRRIAISGYFPNIAVFAKQNIYSYHIPANLAPRSVVGAGMAWNLFDGLNREMDIKLSNKALEELSITKEKTTNDLKLAAKNYLSQVNDAVYNLNALKTTIELCNELIYVRQKSFKEGMATATDVVYAQTTLANANLAISLAKYQYSIALANLMTLSGIGYEFINMTINN